MNSRERVLAAIGHVQPDRVPVAIDFSPEIQGRLEAHLGVDERGFAAWLDEDLAQVSPRFRGPASAKCYADPTIEVTADGCYLDIWRVPFREARTEFQTYMDLAGRPPLADCQTLDELDRFPWPSPDAWDYSKIAGELADLGEKATWGHSRGFFEIAHFMRGMVEFLTDLAAAPEFACRLMDHIIEYLLERTRRVLRAGAGRFVLFEYNDDIGSQRGLFISPGMWREHVKPRMARFCETIHAHGALVRYHSCGSVRAILPDLIEIGVDVLTPCQPLAVGMDPFELKAAFGERMTFHGGIDIQDLLPHGTPEQVRRHTGRMIDVVGAGGGYILGTSHTLQADTPVENVVAMVEEARR